MAPERTVIEISRSGEDRRRRVVACRNLRDQGFKLALENVMFFDASEGLLELAEVVTLDLSTFDEDQLPWLRDECHAAGVSMVVHHVDGPDDFDRGRSLGFDLFQGYLLATPPPEPGQPLDAGRLARMRMSAQLLDQEFELDDIEEIIRTDPAMTHQLLQLAGIGAAGGIAAHGRHRPRGTRARGMAPAAGVGGPAHAHRPRQHLRRGDRHHARPRPHGRAGRQRRRPDPVGPAFMAGLLSCLDVLTGARRSRRSWRPCR